MFAITHKDWNGHETVVHAGHSLDDAVGYMAAIIAPNVERRVIRHSLTHPSFGLCKSFTASAPKTNLGMYRLERTP